MFYPRHVGREKRNGLSQVKCEERTFFKNLKGNIIDTPSVMPPVLLITTLVFLPFRNHMVCVCWTALCHHSLLREHPEHMATIPQHLPQDVTDLGSLILHLNEQEPNFLTGLSLEGLPRGLDIHFWSNQRLGIEAQNTTWSARPPLPRGLELVKQS